ncbi:MAG: beta-carotene hydroxylase [Flavitalea sp.]
MHWLVYMGIVVLTFLIMEGITWATHKYIMHGWLWYLHEDHHRKRTGFFEKNDMFFIIFALPSFSAILIGTIESIYWMQAIGFGVMTYGAAYFLVHDVIIHQRFKWFSKSNSIYIQAIRRAHKMHHKHLDKEEGESFGMLYVHKKYWEQVRKNQMLRALQK